MPVEECQFDGEGQPNTTAVDLATGRTIRCTILDGLDYEARQDRLSDVGLMAAGIAHDFGNILQIMESGLRIIERRLDPGASEMLGLTSDLREAASRASALTTLLLGHIRGTPLRTQAVDIGLLMLQLRPLIIWAAGPTVSVTVEIQTNLPCVDCQAVELQSAVVNLAINARHAMPDGGRLAVSVNRDGDHLLLRVADTGCGLSPEELRRVCEPFVTSRAGRGGSGLGLSMVRRFAERAGGSMTIESRLGRGATFVLKLPILKEGRA